MVRNQWYSRYLKISTVRSVYSFILRYYTLVNVPVVITSFFPFCRMKEDFMELYLVMLCCSNVVQVPLSLNPFQINLEFGTTHRVALCEVRLNI